ncbi:MFS transporter [Agrobacterium vitis]|uniref:MFS transporter n=1 Tax=Agrobacterium vitis TaxID=373 RepID=A0AAE2R9F2_AGRVI|nr:MFS transporter [Agrobacterium vitis]NSY15532.1 MFS transporter [Agrobacterium vitis]NSY25289.1 MFS transporter [Agrobacterium vitis]NTA24316.1 MFS transporter [Agrobacterium vitis]
MSASVFGKAMGALIISPIADRIGRRKHVLLCLAAITIAMVLSALAQSLAQLLMARGFAGVFIGELVSSFNSMVSEYSSEKRRETVFGISGMDFLLIHRWLVLQSRR